MNIRLAKHSTKQDPSEQKQNKCNQTQRLVRIEDVVVSERHRLIRQHNSLCVSYFIVIAAAIAIQSMAFDPNRCEKFPSQPCWPAAAHIKTMLEFTLKAQQNISTKVFETRARRKILARTVSFCSSSLFLVHAISSKTADQRCDLLGLIS